NWAVSVSLVHRFWRSWPSYRATHDRQNEVLGDQHYAADGLAAFDEGVGGGCVREREGAVYEDLQAAGRDVVDVALDHLARAVVGDLGAEEDAGQRLVAHHQHRGVERLRIAAGLADEAAAASVGERLDAADQHLAADRIDDEVDAPAIGGGSHLVDPTALGVVDGDVEAEVLQGLEAFEARRCRQHPRAGALGQLDGGHTDPAGAGLDKDGLTFFQAPELEEAIIGGAEGDGYARTGHDVGAVGDGPRDDRGNGDPLADVAVGDAVTHLGDCPRALVAHDVGHRRHLAAGAVEGVAPFDADGLDVDDDHAGPDLWIRHVLVTEDIGRTGLVVHGGLHAGEPYAVPLHPALGIGISRRGIARGWPGRNRRSARDRR